MSENNTTPAEVLIQMGELHLDEVNLIITGLNELPAKYSFGLIDKIRNIAQAQLPADLANPAAPA